MCPPGSFTGAGISLLPGRLCRPLPGSMAPPLPCWRAGSTGSTRRSRWPFWTPGSGGRDTRDDTSSVIRLAEDRRMPPSPQGEGLRRALREAPLRREATGRRGRQPLQRDRRGIPGEFQKGHASPFWSFQLGRVQGGEETRNLPLPGVVFFGTFLLDKQKKGTLRVRGSLGAGDRKGRPYEETGRLCVGEGLAPPGGKKACKRKWCGEFATVYEFAAPFCSSTSGGGCQRS